MELLLSQSAEYYLRLARESFRLNDPLGARMAYLLCIDSWKKASRIHPLFMGQLHAAEEEYRCFDRFDYFYKGILHDLRTVVLSYPRIAQTDLMERMTQYHPRDVEYTLYFAMKEGKILFQREGNDYILRLPKEPAKSGKSGFIRFSRN
ncbi:MAG TPA: hypothetical protein VMW43_10105 [Bacteroidota bacterium]|nr:hypothetical protein [Bacteroidota bacterium]